MLTAKEQEKITEEATRYERKSAACIEALRVVQESRGWVSDESIQDIANALEMTCDEVDAVATFYNLIFREPVGKRVLFICDSVSCWTLGCDSLRDCVRERFGIGYGETSRGGNLTILPIACLGACDHAPVAMLDGELLSDLDPGRLLEALGEKKLEGA